MTKTIEVGYINTLKIDRESEYGLFLTDSIGESVLLPKAYVTKTMQVGDTIDVFVYTDSEDRVVATTLRPLAKRGEFALMKVTDTASFGAFADWGLPKELLIPKKMQKHPLQVGKNYIIHVAYDEETDRLVGDTRIGRYLYNNPHEMRRIPKEVDLLIVARTPMGYKVIANNRYEGMLYHNEIYEKISIGERKKGYIKKIRDDGKLDISLQPVGKAKEEDASQKVLTVLAQNDGTLPFTYKSAPDAVHETFGISKKAYKKALTKLQDEGKITLSQNHMELKTS